MEQSQPIPPETPLEATLPAGEWNVILGLLQEAPYRVAAPIIGHISEQFRAREIPINGAAAASPSPAPLPNGAAAA